MTILPKKKQNKNNGDDDRDKDHPNERYNYGQISNSNQNGQISPNSRNWSSRSDDKRSAPDSDCPSDHSNLGNPHIKRRHRNNRERDGNSDLTRSLIGSVRNKSSHNSPSSSPRDLNRGNVDGDLCMPGSSGMMTRQESELAHSGLIVPRVNHEMKDDKKDNSGYNSGDEYQKPSEHWTNNDWDEKERIFERIIRKKGLIIKKMQEDGACLFRAVADQVYGDQDMHASVRKLCMDYMEKNCDYFSQYVTENFSSYIQRKRDDRIHGNHIEIQAMSEIFNRPIEVYHYTLEPINTFQGVKASDEPIRLSYHRNVHYNSIVDPYKATIGVGLGLPSFKPGLADKTLMEKAMLISEQHELEQAMLEDKIRATDWEATNDAIEEQIARESYLEWLHESELRSRKKKHTTSATSTQTKFIDDENPHIPSPKGYHSPRSTVKSPSIDRDIRSPKRNEDPSSKSNCYSRSIENEATDFVQVAPYAHTLETCQYEDEEDEDDDDVLARVLAQSQAEYLDSLKSAHSASKSTTATNDMPAKTDTTSGDYISNQPSTSNYRS